MLQNMSNPVVSTLNISLMLLLKLTFVLDEQWNAFVMQKWQFVFYNILSNINNVYLQFIRNRTELACRAMNLLSHKHLWLIW